jgi:signal transduction histidine kinase
MFDKAVIRIRNASLMDLAIYLTLFIFLGTGLATLPNMVERLTVSALLIAFGLAHAFGYRIASSQRHVNVYMAVQALITAVMFLRFPAADLFSFLLFILVIQVTIALPPRIAARWVVVLFTIESFRLIQNWGVERAINLLIFAPGYYLTAVFGYSLRRAEIVRREKESLLEELRATQNQLQELAVTEERTRLARELHDSLGHRLTVAVVQLEGAQRLIPTRPEQASNMIGIMREELKDALAELRITVSAMRDPIAKNQPLELFLSTLTQSFQKNTGLVTHFAASELPELPESYRLAFYRALQEGLTNIQRHAGAQNAWIKLETDHEQIILTIEDDGKGLDQMTEKGSGVGLVGLGERASQLGGEMRIIRRETGGTKLIFTIPVPEE